MSEIATFATYMAVCHVPVLRNCFLIVPCLVLHEDVENAIFLALSHFFLYLLVELFGNWNTTCSKSNRIIWQVTI